MRMITHTRKRESKNEENPYQLQQSPIKFNSLLIIYLYKLQPLLH